MIPGTPEPFTAEERARLAPYFSSLDGPVFALVNLPEVVKGALFARYSRSPKSLRRLFLDEFVDAEPAAVIGPSGVGVARAEKLYERVLDEYGDDSVAQLGGVHLACEGVSNVMTKVLEWGRLMAYLEQSTRYIPYTDRPGGRWRYHVPEELAGFPELRRRYVEALDGAFETYARWLGPIQEYFARRHPPETDQRKSEVRPLGAEPLETHATTVRAKALDTYPSTIRAKALDTIRGLLPAATLANVGLYGTGQAYEALLLRLRSHELAEARAFGELILTELRKVIPAFLRRLGTTHGEAWSHYLQETRDATRLVATKLLGRVEAEPREQVTLTEFDPDGEVKVVAAALYAVSDLPDDQLLARARAMSAEERQAVLRAYVGDRKNRRHKPGRAFERTAYRFDVLTDYGAFRDLQRHRLLTLEWQLLSPRHGYEPVPEAVEEAGGGDDWRRTMDASAALYGAMVTAGLPAVAPYAVCMAYRVRFYMAMNAREAMHVIELRTSPQGHPSYRRVCQRMHELIAEQHPAIADAIQYVNRDKVELERRKGEWRAEARRFNRTLGQAAVRCEIALGTERGLSAAAVPRLFDRTDRPIEVSAYASEGR